MFTVVITEQEHLEGMEGYRPYLLPFMDRSDICFCRWFPEGESLAEAVPDLMEAVYRRDCWRLIVVMPDQGIRQKNPFELVHYENPVRDPEEDLKAYLNRVRSAKKEAYYAAARLPLTRLMTWLCASPLVTSGQNQAEADPEFAEYAAEIQIKNQLREEIRSSETLEIPLPSEILCLARRCCQEPDYDIKRAWNSYYDAEYSRFYDWNLYFDKMRYLIFDTLPKNHVSYNYDYLRFLYVLALLAHNEIPQSSLAPNRVYNIFCQTDEQTLRRLLEKYDDKLKLTEENLTYECEQLIREKLPAMSDEEARKQFCIPITIPVSSVSEFDESSLYASGKVAIATDVPVNETVRWQEDYRRSGQGVVKYLKTPRRALKKAGQNLRMLCNADLNYAGRLNDFQLEDVADFTAEEELQMVSTSTMLITDGEKYTREMEKNDREIRKRIRRRLTAARCWTLSLSAVGLYGLSFLFMWIMNRDAEEGVFLSAMVALGCVGLLGLAALVTLICLRSPLKHQLKAFNQVIFTLIQDMHRSMTHFSIYMSHACNMMRGYSILNFRREHENPNDLKIKVFKKHIYDIRRKREEVREVFGFLLLKSGSSTGNEEPYPYDFTRAVDYPYPVPYMQGQWRMVEFMQKGNLVEVPVDFIRRIGIRREELYD